MEREVDSGHRRNKTKEWREVKWTPRNNNKDGEKKVQTMDTVETKRRGKEREVDREPKKGCGGGREVESESVRRI